MLEFQRIKRENDKKKKSKRKKPGLYEFDTKPKYQTDYSVDNESQDVI